MKREITEKDLFDLVQASELAESMLSDREREVLSKVNKEKDECEEKLGRPLNDDEAMTIEQSVPGGWDVVVKLGSLEFGAYKQVLKKGKKLQ